LDARDPRDRKRLRRCVSWCATKIPLGFVLSHQVFDALLQRTGGCEHARRWRGYSALAQQMTRRGHTSARASLGQGKRADLSSMPAWRRKQGIPATRLGRLVPVSGSRVRVCTCVRVRVRVLGHTGKRERASESVKARGSRRRKEQKPRWCGWGDQRRGGLVCTRVSARACVGA
jgi:hypothetical protein